MNNTKKLAIGSMLATIGACGIFFVPLLGGSQIESLWDYILGFFLGLSAGSGVAIAIYALIQKRFGR